MAGVLHDVGKIGVSDPVLVKTGPLGEDDWRELRTHPEIGAQLLSRPELADLRAWVLAHHERPDGTGYPSGLSGDEIPLEARILAVADAYEAMTRDRVYRGALGREAAREELRAGSGSQFDGKVVDAFLRGARARAGRGGRTCPRQLSQSSHKVLRSCTVSCPGGGAEATARFASQTARRRHPLGNARTQDNRRTALAARGAAAGPRRPRRSRCRCSWPRAGRCSRGPGSPRCGSSSAGCRSWSSAGRAPPTNPRTMVGLLSVSLMGRIWFMMFAVLAIGLIDRDSGLPAAVLTAVTFQAWFTGFMVSKGMEGD